MGPGCDGRIRLPALIDTCRISGAKCRIMSRSLWLIPVLLFAPLLGTLPGQASTPAEKSSAVGYVDCLGRESNRVPTYLDMCRSESSAELACGRSVTVLERHGRWLKIEVAEGDTRYIIARAVSQRADQFIPFYPASNLIPNLGPPNCLAATEHPTGAQDQPPHAIYSPEPEYSDKARKKKINGDIMLSLIVGTDGLPRDVTVEKPLGYGLDEQAVKAVQQWRFQPAQHEGQPVEKRIEVSVSFRVQ